MSVAEIHNVLGDPERLAALDATGLMDSPPEESIDRFTRLAKRLLGADATQLSFIDDHREYHKSQALPDGLVLPVEVPLSQSICHLLVASGEELAVGDLRDHPTLQDHPAVQAGVVAYAGVPVGLRRGTRLGSLCAVGYAPREWTDEDLETLRDLGAALTGEIELRTELRRRRSIEQDLAEAHQQLRSILDHSPASVYLKDLTGRYLVVNPHVCAHLGRAEEDIVGHLDLDIIEDQEACARIRQQEERIIATGEACEEVTLMSSPRGRRYMRILKFPIRDASGQIYAVGGLSTDETERVEHEEALRTAEERLRWMFEDSPVAMAMLNQGKFSQVNEALCELTGRSREELLTLSTDQIFHRDDFARDAERIAELRTGGIRTLKADTRLLTPDGGIREVVLNGTGLGRDGDGVPAEHAIQLIDMTDRNRARRLLNLRQEATRVLLATQQMEEAVPNALVPLTEMLNAAHASLWLEGGDGELQPAATWSALHGVEPDESSLEALRLRALQERAIAWSDGGTCLPVQTHLDAAPLGVVAFYGVETEVPHEELAPHLEALGSAMALFVERRRNDEELARARDEALAASKMKSSFLANMSHEIRTPMNGVIGMTDLLLDSELTDEQQRWATTLATSGRALLTIINDILDFSKVEAGKLELERLEFDVGEVVDATCDILSDLAGRKGIGLEAFLERRVPERMWGDPGRLQQVLTNLVANAVKFTETGSVTIRVSVAADRENALRFAVSDTGIGIEPEKIEELFQPFSQADSSTTRRFGGTGLGLTISRQLVDLMGGEIGATSTPGVGTTFHFTLPIGEAQPGATATAPPATRPAAVAAADSADAFGAGLCVLVVDDNEINRMVAVDMLRRHGYEVEVACNGREAVDAIARREFGVVLMDCQMPVMDGYEATREIRRLEGGDRHVPIVALTAGSMQGDREAALEAGMDGFLPKPVTADSLVRAVSQAAVRTADDANGDALDRKVFDTLLAGSGSVERAGMLADLFDRESQGVVAELRDAFADGDASRVAKAAHGLKGSSSTLGAKRVAALAADMERAGREERLSDAAALMERLEPAVAAATAALQAAAAA